MKYLFFLTLGLVGCAYRTPVVHVPEARALDEAQVTVEGDDADVVRSDVHSLLTKRGDEQVRVHVSLDEKKDFVSRALHQDGFAIFGLWPIFFGMTHESQSVTVDVEVDARDGRTLVGHATAEKAGSLYAKARRRAIAAALDRALAALR